MKRARTATLAATVLLCSTAIPSFALPLPQSFVSLSKVSVLNHPGIIVVDPKTNEILYESNPDITRAPASVLKLVSTTSALKQFGPDKTFSTSISATDKPNKFVLVGEGDPWLTTSKLEATKYKRAYLPSLINAAIEKSPHIKAISLQYKNIYYQDIQAIQRFYKGRIKIYPHAISDTTGVESPIAQIISPKLSSIIEFTLLWSDNLLAARMSLLAAKAQGYSADSLGLQSSFEKLFQEMNVPANGLVVKDGAGLSHATRISARTIAELLVKIKTDPSLNVIYEGLPLSGVSGTLKNRFTKDAPTAVGLIKAKTGWINTTVSLAGFVDSGENNYVFAVIADNLPNRESARQSARIAIDKMLATIAKPTPGVPVALPSSAPEFGAVGVPTND
jgi:D-alanyl-D-alanine carboxypeptidase/D-alanyl-D-alanine-endopeptidase (penicillin-binding protein 4)